jgi:hypothetical protein
VRDTVGKGRQLVVYVRLVAASIRSTISQESLIAEERMETGYSIGRFGGNLVEKDLYAVTSHSAQKKKREVVAKVTRVSLRALFALACSMR